METIEAPGGGDSPESCPELDDEYFSVFDNMGMEVVDSWEDKSNEGSSNDVKVEPEDSVEASSARASSRDIKTSSRNRNDSDNSNRDPRLKNNHRDKENDKRSETPDRPDRSRRPAPYRRSPPKRRSRSRSPPRHPRRDVQPRRNNAASSRPSFLEEITRKIPELKQDSMRNNMMPGQPRFNNHNMYGYGMNPMMPGAQFMQQPNFGQVPNQPFHQNGAYQVDAFGQPMHMNPFMNQMMQNPQMPIASPMMFEQQPMPVPAPLEMQTFSAQGVNDARLKPSQNPEPPVVVPPAPNLRGIDLQEAKKKAFADGKISMTEYLLQMSKQKARKTTAADINAKRAKVQERCKKAAQLMDELSKNKIQLPFVLRASEKSVPSMTLNSMLAFKSPLTMSDTNVQFLSQSGLPGCREAMLGNPLRNVSGKLFQLARNVGADVIDLSLKVQKHADIEKEKASILSKDVEISKTVISAAQKKVHCSSQTEPNLCDTCAIRSAKKFDMKAVQTKESGEQVKNEKKEEEPGSFNVNLSAQSMEGLNENQQRVLLEFCHAFNIQDSRFGTNSSRWSNEDDRNVKREPEDRMSYANPENPNIPTNFISFSPIRETALSRSPPRLRIADRLGDKIPSPRHSPDLRAMRRSIESRDVFRSTDSRGVRRSPRRDPHRSPTRRSSRDNASSRFYEQSSPYLIPSPRLAARYSRDEDRFARDSSPFSSQGYRNRSRSLSPDRSPLRTRQRRSGSPDSYSQRRGRY